MKCILNGFKTRKALLNPVFETLENVNAGTMEHEAATDLICQTLYLCEDIRKYSELIEYLKRNIMNLQSTYHAVQIAEDQVRNLVLEKRRAL